MKKLILGCVFVAMIAGISIFVACTKDNNQSENVIIQAKLDDANTYISNFNEKSASKMTIKYEKDHVIATTKTFDNPDNHHFSTYIGENVKDYKIVDEKAYISINLTESDMPYWIIPFDPNKAPMQARPGGSGSDVQVIVSCNCMNGEGSCKKTETPLGNGLKEITCLQGDCTGCCSQTTVVSGGISVGCMLVKANAVTLNGITYK